MGARIKLSCNAEYDLKLCGYVEVAWHQCVALENCTELRDPNRYVTVVNETVLARTSLRHRQVVTEIIQLTPADEGEFQCHAKCEINSDTAMGHYITVKGILLKQKCYLIMDSCQICWMIKRKMIINQFIYSTYWQRTKQIWEMNDRLDEIYK